MQEDCHEKIISQLNKTHMELKIRLEQVSKLRIDCAKMQLELLKLYKPQCLEVLEMLLTISTPGNFSDGIVSDDDNRDGSLNNEGSEVLRANEDVSRKSTT
nr:PREDICTED: uncharacterized protein LOC105676788 [Linepithema humile]